MTSTAPDGHGALAGSIVIPAHNEARTIGRLLDLLLDGTRPGVFEIVVVCNGCTDRTADVARSRDVTVVELAEPSKREAVRRGDDVAVHFPRVHLDADVEISARDVLRLLDAVGPGGHLASGPRRLLPREGVSLPVRWYYDVWESLPQVRSGLFGRGVIALSRTGNERVRTLPLSMADDLVMSEAFAAHEVTIVPDAVVVVHPPRTLADLLRRRVRVSTGNAQADGTGLRTDASRTTVRDLLDTRRTSLGLLAKTPIFLAVTLASRVASRRAVRAGDFTTWHRDESSRA